ncbi:MAG: hypothetical protein IJL87_00350 [Clostridia bacterium]|nr:hypothetical protein [Clostridia bacterium]
MTNNELIERYVYDVTRRLPGGIRSDTGSEIKGLIEDMLAERCGDVTPEKQDVVAVLAELGAPADLAAKYDPSGDRSLIGPKYFRTYIKVLKIVLLCSFFGIIAAQLLAMITEGVTGSVWEIGAHFLGVIWNTVLSAFAIVTVIFAIFEWKKVDLSSDEDVLKLPPVPEKKEKISATECIIGIAVSIVLAVILLFFPQIAILGAHFSKDGNEVFRLFTEDAFRNIWYLVVISFSAGIVRDCYKLFVGRYNFGVALVSTVCNIITMIVTPIIVFHPNVFNNPADFLGPEASETAVNLLGNLPLIITAAVFLGCIVGTVECWVRALRYSKNNG